MIGHRFQNYSSNQCNKYCISHTWELGKPNYKNHLLQGDCALTAIVVLSRGEERCLYVPDPPLLQQMALQQWIIPWYSHVQCRTMDIELLLITPGPYLVERRGEGNQQGAVKQWNRSGG